MRDVSIAGIGQTPVAEHWNRSVRDLAVEAVRAAMHDAGIEHAGALFAGNMLSGAFCGQENLATLIADFAGMRGAEAVKIEAACASGAAAIRAAHFAVASGAHDIAVAVGVEKMTDVATDGVTAGLSSASDADFEAAHGISFTALNALMMRMYMERYGWRREDFAGFTINAHHNACSNPHSLFRDEVSAEEFMRSPIVADPISILDSAPICDGAAAVVLVKSETARSLHDRPVRIRGAASATDSISVATRRDPLSLDAASVSAQRAYTHARVRAEDIDFFELHDAFTIMAALSLEAAGFAERGKGVAFAIDGRIGREGSLPISTCGGLKGRGHPVGASGAYQMVEAVWQLRGAAGGAQVKNCRLGMTQSIGGSGSVVITHILEAA